VVYLPLKGPTMELKDINAVRVSLTDRLNISVSHEDYENWGPVNVVAQLIQGDLYVTLKKDGHYAGTKLKNTHRFEVSRAVIGFTKRRIRFGSSPVVLQRNMDKNSITFVIEAAKQAIPRKSCRNKRGHINMSPKQIVDKAGPQPSLSKGMDQRIADSVPLSKNPLTNVRTRDMVRELNIRADADDTMTLEIRGNNLVVLVEYS
jgi:hypothetical protein